MQASNESFSEHFSAELLTAYKLTNIFIQLNTIES